MASSIAAQDNRKSESIGPSWKDGKFLAAGQAVGFKVAEIEGGDPARPIVAADLLRLAATLSNSELQVLNAQANDWVERHKTPLQFVYGAAGPAFALTSPDLAIHAGRLMPNPD